ncbi:MAG TPA: hypothetical protein VL120_14960 [Solirubrobacteraceae bacterium]|nr:hypothetical protein [Solirubrobacteraceae bacterium]
MGRMVADRAAGVLEKTAVVVRRENSAVGVAASRFLHLYEEGVDVKGGG